MAPKPVAVSLSTRRWCGYYFASRRLFTQLGIDFEEIVLDDQPERRQEVSKRAGNWRTVPMIFIGNRFVGGYREAAKLHRSGELEKLLSSD